MLDLLDALVALVEAPCDVLREALDLDLLVLLGLVVVEAGQDVRLVQLVEPLALDGDLGEELGDFVRDVGPARGQQVHLDHGVAIVLECAAREQPAAVRVEGKAAAAGVGI